MKRWARWLALASSSWGVAFGCPAEDEPVGQHGEHGETHDADEGHREPGDNLLRIDGEMLRDLRVTTQVAESRPAGDAVTVLGGLRVNEDAYAEVGSPITARVSNVLAAPGDVVAAGRPLVELDSLEVGKTRAALATSRARLELARQTVERRRELAHDQIIPQRELQAAQAELTQAEAELRAAEDSLASMGASRGASPAGAGSRFILTSPIGGTIIDRAAVRGRMVDPEVALFIIGDLSHLWLIAHAFERDALRVRTGTNATVTFPALPGQSMIGTVTRLGNRVDPTSRTVDVRIELDNPSGVLRPGMSASALVPVGEPTETVVTVPIEAVQRQPQGWCVFIPGPEEGLFEIRSVGRGRDLGGEVEVLSGLRAGERVVVDGAFLLKAEADKTQGGGEGEHHH